MNWIGHEKYLAEGNWILYQVTPFIRLRGRRAKGKERAPGGGGGVLPYMGYIGMCGPKWYGFSDVVIFARTTVAK